MLTAVARDRWNLSAVFKFCFCFVLLYNKSLNNWYRGEQWILLPANLNETLSFPGNKIHCSPRDQSLSVKYSTLPQSSNFTGQVKRWWQNSQSRLLTSKAVSDIGGPCNWSQWVVRIETCKRPACGRLGIIAVGFMWTVAQFWTAVPGGIRPRPLTCTLFSNFNNF